MAESTLGALRHATEELHQQLDAQVRKFGALTSREQFVRHLEILRQHHVSELTKISEQDSELRLLLKQRVDELVHDLQQLGVEASPPALAAVAAPVTSAEALGRCYVVEGSRLGAVVIGRFLREQGFVDVSTLRSIGGESNEVRERWKRFAARLSVLDAESEPDCVAGAVHSFETLLASYNPCE